MIELDGVTVPIEPDDYVGDLSPFDHQAAAERLIKETDDFWAVNSSPTGSGKTYSWVKPVVEQGIDTIVLYPTNALTVDQQQAIDSFIDEYYPDEDIDVVRATSETVAKWRDKASTQIDKGQALRRRIGRSFDRHDTTILITNPDTFVLVRKDLYGHRFTTQQINRFQMVVLDEFHLANVKQRDSMLFLLDELDDLPDTIAKVDQFFFLTATPDGDDETGRGLLSRIKATIGVQPHHITANARPSTSDGMSSQSSDAKTVMPPINLELRGGATFRTADTLLAKEIFDEFSTFCANGKTVVMVDGVDEVDRIYEALSDALPTKNVEQISGFHRGDVHQKLETFDILVSNSAVEVGLDFKPDRVVFSASDAATLVQRLGRVRNKSEDVFDGTYRAWCYVPPSVRARLERSLKRMASDGRVARKTFETLVNKAFTDMCDLSSFTYRWSDRIAYHHVRERVKNAPRDRAIEILNDGEARIRRHFYDPFRRAFARNELEILEEETNWRLLDRVQTYRGDSLQVMVYDSRQNQTKLADLFYVLRWGNLRFYSPDEFRTVLPAGERDFFSSNKRYALGFCEYRGKIDRVEGPSGYPGRSVTLHDQFGGLHAMADTEPRVANGLGISVTDDGAPSIEGLDHLKDHMANKNRVCYVLSGSPHSNEAVYDFDEFFFVYPLDDASVTIGTTALFTHCLVQDRREREQQGRWDW